MKEKLQNENQELKEKNVKLLKQNKTLLSKKKEESSSEGANNQELKAKLDETTKELSVLKSTHDTLKKTLDNTKVSSENEVAQLCEKLKKSESENKIIYSELQKAKEIVKSAELKSQEDAENCQKLAFILESYEKQVSLLKEELANSKTHQNNEETIETLKSANLKLQTHLDMVQAKAQQETGDLKLQLDEKIQEISRLTKLNSESHGSSEEILKLRNEIETLKKSAEDNASEKETLHSTYVNIITDNIKRYIDSELILSEEVTENPHTTEFSKQVENIFKILLEFKHKCEDLEKKLMEASNEKTKILNEKYEEIEKLIQNSEVLSQEVIKKAEMIKELESEVTNLITSNDVLLSELDSYRNAGLQTISESNEDNMVLLETDLENANKRIRELEDIIDSPSKSSNASNISLEGKVSQKQEDYQDLLNSFDDLKLDYDDIAYKLNKCNEKIKSLETENEDLRGSVEKIKGDFENTDYQLSEANFALDSLKDELETMKLNDENLRQENKELKLQSMNNIDLKSELNELKEKYLTEENLRRELEAQAKTLTEKLQSIKVTETSLKLQYDTLNKEQCILREAKNGLEESLKSAKTSISEYENNYTELLQKYDSVLVQCEELNTQLHQKDNEILLLKNAEEDNKKIKELLEENAKSKTGQDELVLKLKEDLEVKEAEIAELKAKLNDTEKEEISKQPTELLQESENLQEELTRVQTAFQQSQDNVAILQQQLQELANSRNDLINMVTIKHQESLNYHNEIQRLSEILKNENQKYSQLEAKLVQTVAASDQIAKKNEEIDKLTDELNFMKEKCEVVTKNLLEEQSKLQKLLVEKSGPSDKELSLSKQLERLQSHLIELEERYTQELLQAEQKNAELQAKLMDLEQREKNSSTMYTSVSIRANQQVETLRSQLQTVTNQREELRKKISDAEDLNNKQAAALANLQFVLEQFQKDKEKDVHKETERIRRQMNQEKHVQDDLRKEIENLTSQLEESKIGLQAASRLSDQLELLKKQNVGLKDEVSQLQQKLAKSQQTIHELTSQTDGKIDKSLIKSLIVGFLSSGNMNNWNKDQTQVLKLIATVLDFNQQDHDKVKLNKPQQGSWLGSILHPQSTSQNMSQESLSQAFVKFLENESKPRVVPSLLDEPSRGSNGASTESSKRTTPRATPSPIVLNEVVLPTFADFGQSRNSSSILKDVLKENNG